MSINFEPKINSTQEVPGFDNDISKISLTEKTDFVVPNVKMIEGSPFVNLPTPIKSIADVDMSAFVGIPSPGADVLALLSDLADEQRRANREQMMAQTQAAVATIKEQAQMTRDQAVSNLVMGLVSSTIQIGTSLSSAIGSGKIISSTEGIADAGLRAAMMQAKSTQLQGFTQSVSGLADMLDATKGFISSQNDAAIKEKDAQLEMIRAFRAQLESLDDVFKELIHKATSTHDSIQQTTNQTRTRILG